MSKVRLTTVAIAFASGMCMLAAGCGGIRRRCVRHGR